MVAQLLRLRAQLTLNLFRRSPRQVAGTVVLGLVGIALLVVLVNGVVSLAEVRAANARDLLVVIGSFVLLGYCLVPAMFSVGDPMDPRAFALFGVPAPRLAGGLLLTGVVSVPGVVLVVLCGSTVVPWARDGLSTVLAVVAALIAVATCTLASRIAELLSTASGPGRRSRELRVIFLLLLLIFVAPAVVFVLGVDWKDGSGLVEFGRAAEVVSWTPFGAVWSVPGDAALGETGEALAKLGVAVLALAVLWLGWIALVARATSTLPREIRQGSFGSLGWFDALPARPAGVIAARSLSYWGRDARYIVSILVIPILPFVLIPPLLIAGVPAEPLALVPVPVMSLLIGWSLHNDLAYDSSAVWLHVVSGVPGRSDRFGRTIPTLFIAVPLVVIGSMIATAFYGDWTVLPSLLGVSGCLALSGIGISSVLSVRHPYPASAPGDSPFQQPQTTGSDAAYAQIVGLVLPVVAAVPALWFAWVGITEDPVMHMASLAAGLGVGLAVFVAGILIGGRMFDRRGPEIMEFATSI